MHLMVNQKFTNQNEFLGWHDQLLWCEKRRLKNSCGYTLNSQKTSSEPMSSHVLYVHKGKLIIIPSQEKLEMSQSHF